MEETPTDVFLPPGWPYPITISTIDAPQSSTVSRGSRLLSYSYQYLPRGSLRPETRFGTWDSAIDGDIQTWNIRPGDIVSVSKAKQKPALVVKEPCKHGVQHMGLCVLCGKDMTNTDYIGFSDTSRASIQMTHSANGPTVSLEEAQRIERETADHLIKTRKLSLIVDLDQTIVHATVDPTVGEWIAEGKAWEEKHKQNGHTPPSASDDDECNPNWEALKDVKEFRLAPETFGGPVPDKAQNKAIETDGCMYYIKPRPGWQSFLTDIAERYEMHVYTMGTRAYAEKVCAAIDPEGKLFGGRLLSRDESGSLTQKSLKRLFPCDTSMVVIIDDRGDVWEWSPNLIKVVPFDFFVGIGDINSAFLPKLPTTNSPVPPQPMPAALEDPTLSTKAMMTQNSIALEAQVEERPLAKMQEKLADIEEEESKEDTTSELKDDSEQQHHPHHHHKKALLKSQDSELERVGKILVDVHRRYFQAYDSAPPPPSGKRKRGLHDECDVTTIIPEIRAEVLRGVHIVFSSMFPLDIRPQATDVWKMAEAFGARCSTELQEGVTHVVAAKQGTDKVNIALRKPTIKVVWNQWLTECVNMWKKVDETPYLMDPTTASRVDVLTHGVVVKDKHPAGGELEIGDIDWNDINDEVEAAMNESDDDEDEGYHEGVHWADEDDESVTNTPRKRSRSTTPKSDTETSSPDSKRRKLEGSSLKETVSAHDLANQPDEDEEIDDDDDDDEEEDDFLAKELEEDWG